MQAVKLERKTGFGEAGWVQGKVWQGARLGKVGGVNPMLRSGSWRKSREQQRSAGCGAGGKVGGQELCHLELNPWDISELSHPASSNACESLTLWGQRR